MSRMDGAIGAVLKAMAACAPRLNSCLVSARDDDLIDDLGFDAGELESLGLILEEVFSIEIPSELWHSPLYRTAASLAEWLIRQCDLAAAEELQRQRRRA